ncbi:MULTISPECIES: hypothetical protein [unclassified Shinella]|uniref:hypothetical protein n=1 Tax=unclassified Shinella TaxID=2643062 RepID=UPI00234E9A37|nr:MULTISPECIES: hypothetical protein [unclassified Shinella]MCO5136906.1 hypothetical protein [Shinella sp.]MDC7253417.1 hypothetical protein [Shinella sp. YE25]
MSMAVLLSVRLAPFRTLDRSSTLLQLLRHGVSAALSDAEAAPLRRAMLYLFVFTQNRSAPLLGLL